MVGKLTKAYVNFFREARGRRIVDISKIINYKPATHLDFDEDATYYVKSPHLSTDISFSEEGEFDAKIICLGGKEVSVFP